MKYILNIWIASVVLISSGIIILCRYCTGTTTFNFSWPVDGSRLSLDLATNGAAVWAGIPLIVTGLIALLLALALSIVAQFLPDHFVLSKRTIHEEPSSRHGILSITE